MPYINKDDRSLFDEGIYRMSSSITSWGRLSYVITSLCLDAIGADGDYARIAAILGVLESVKLELYRRPIARYEEEKILANGDIAGM